MAKQQKKKLVIIHVDGLSYRHLHKVLASGHMPYVKHLVEKQHYRLLRYRTGIPSTTPFAQAGILYGTNHNIPSFTWFDKQSGIPVRFGTLSSFKKVAHKYFAGSSPITKNGATIAACYPAGAAETFALAYNDPKSKTITHRKARKSVLIKWLQNPLHIIDWFFLTIYVASTYFFKLCQTQITRENVAVKYFVVDLLQEIFLHHMTRYATAKAMELKYPVIYAALYAYDDASHAFGPDNSFSYAMARQVDRSIKYIDKKREKHGQEYDLLILSDHGQNATIPFVKRQKKHLGELIAGWYPTYDVLEIPGKHIEPIDGKQDGEIVITYSGGIGHIYLRNIHGRADLKQVTTKLPDITEKLIKLSEIGEILIKKDGKDVLITKKKMYTLDTLTLPLKAYLKKLDDPHRLFSELKRLNTFDKAGDIIFFGSFIRGKQVNFENQFGGHGAYGGDQMHPFVLVKKDWNVSRNQITHPEDIYTLLKRVIA